VKPEEFANRHAVHLGCQIDVVPRLRRHEAYHSGCERPLTILYSTSSNNLSDSASRSCSSASLWYFSMYV
jgi:hypothetical protein